MKWLDAIAIVLALVWGLIKEAFQTYWWIFLLVFIVAVLGNSFLRKPEPDIIHRETDCSGCNGKGKVYYGPDHPVIQISGDKPGEYTCPYCGGSGKVAVEIRE